MHSILWRSSFLQTARLGARSASSRVALHKHTILTRNYSRTYSTGSTDALPNPSFSMSASPAATTTLPPLILANTITCIPGGTRGIGLATAKLFASHGSRVVILGRDQTVIDKVLDRELNNCNSIGSTPEPSRPSLPSSSPTPPSTSSSSSKLPLQHLGFQCDVSKPEDVERVVKLISKQVGAPIDYLINSAGITHDSLLIAQSSSAIDHVLGTNLLGTIHLSKSFAKLMMRQNKKNGGAMVHISSVVGLQGNVGQSVYAASKAGMVGFSKSLAKELGSRGITVNVIAPGYITTDMTDSLPEEKKKSIAERTALGRLGRPEDVAQAALYLVQAKFVTGQVLVVDGGLSL